MEQIQRLVAPPISDETAKRLRRRNRTVEHRRHGRAVNHDCCDSCREGGDLLCCDRCPAAFHLLCHDPPLTEDELPAGEWICHRCRVSPYEGKDDDTESTSSNRSARLKRSAPPETATTTTDSVEPSTSTAEPMEVESTSKEKEEKQEGGDNPFYMLIKAARLMNPSQFELSKDIACNTPLPGSSKRVYGRNYRSVPKKQAHELDGGLVPLPAKVCFVCTKSCRIGPLIQCDYCPLLFHMDCLNPPLTFLPTGRWMCPNHVEHFLDEYMVRTNSLSERVKLWDKYTGMVDQDAVKLRFLSKGHRKNPPFRIKVPLPPRKTVMVPDAVKEHYKNPPSLLPRPERTAQTPLEPASVHKTNYDATPEEQEEWLAAMVSLQTSIAKHMTQKQLQKSSGGLKTGDANKTPESCPAAKPTASVAPVVQRDSESSTSGVASSTDSVTKATDSGVNSESNVGDSKNGVSSDSVNGPQLSQEQVLMSGSIKPGAISLLHGNLGSSGSNVLNGDTEVLDVQKAKVEAAVRTRSNSADAATGPPGLIKVTRTSTDRSASQVAAISGQSGAQSQLPASSSQLPVSQQQLQAPQGKNILISTINKANNSVVTKVLPNPGGTTSKLVLPPGVSARSVGGSPPTSILSPRVLVQPSMRVVGSAAGQVSQTNGVAAGPQTKVISVSTSASGAKTAAVVSGGKTVASTLSSLPAILNLNATLQQWMEGSTDGVPSDLDLSKMDEKLLQLLAWQRLQQLLPPASSTNGDSTSPTVPGRKGLLNGLLTPGSSEVRARAVLCPLTGKGQAISMPYRTLSIGTGADMDVPLCQFGHCNFVSSKHAVIFYDEMTRHFELLNYSEHGTTVDNVLYSCDFSDKPATTPQPSPVVAAVREIISKNKNIKEAESREKRALMSGRSRESTRPCSCKSSSWNLIGGSGAGWEGTALLHHGSYIKLGCLQFVFSIVDQVPQELAPPPPRIKPPEPMSLLKTHLKAV